MSDKAKTAILFSGQGCQCPGMGVEITEKYPSLNYIWDTASEILGFDLYEKCRSAGEDELAVTAVAQPAIMAVSLITCEALKLEGVEFSAAAGHSLGEYAAMTECGILSLSDGFKVIKARSEAMQRCVEASGGNAGVMYAIVGKTAEEIESVCAVSDGYVRAVNYNSAVQTVIAGEEAACSAAAEKLAAEGAKAIKLGVAAAFHSELMRSAADEFKSALEKMTADGLSFNVPKVKMLSNITGKTIEDTENMPERLAAHIVSPVRFTDELYALESMGYDTFIECGPGKVLTGLVRKTLKGVKFASTDSADALAKAAAL